MGGRQTAGRGTRLTEADRAAWAGFAQHIVPLSGRAPRLRHPDAKSATAAPPRATPPDTTPPDATSADAMRPLAARPPSRRLEPHARTSAAVPPLSIGAPPAGVDKATWQRFRTGKLAAPRKLDLHGMTAQRAFQALTSFLRVAQAEHVRCVEIVTGRGSRDRGGEGTGVLRRELPMWLNRPDIRPLVLGAAHPHAANPGAVRLLVRRIR
jgi:DNA-nicking Smr family endonuclease